MVRMVRETACDRLLLAGRGSRSRKSPERGPDVKVVRLLVHKPRPGGRRRVELRRARWQINCEPCADGLIHLSCRYKRLSRSNFILRFWLSHPDSFEPLRPLSLSLSLGRQRAERFSIRPAQRDEIPRYRRERVLSLCRAVGRRVRASVPCPLRNCTANFWKPHIEFYLAWALFFLFCPRTSTHFLFFSKKKKKKRQKGRIKRKEGGYLQLNATKKKTCRGGVIMISLRISRRCINAWNGIL